MLLIWAFLIICNFWTPKAISFSPNWMLLSANGSICWLNWFWSFKFKSTKTLLKSQFYISRLSKPSLFQGKLDINIDLIRCILESNPTVTTLSLYYHGFHEDLESLYQSLSHVKLLNISYQTRFEDHSTLKFDLESLLDVILQNTKFLEIIMIHQSSKTKLLSFSKFATKPACQHKQNTKHLRYLYVYNSTRYRSTLITHNLVSIFFNNYKIDKSKLSPYNSAVKKLYWIDGVLRDNKVDPRRCRLEIDVRGIKKLMSQFNTSW